MSPMNNRRMTPMAEPGILDFAPGAAAVYSLRNLSLSYSSPVVTVRRSTDSAEADFTASEVSDGTLAAWCGGGDGFVKQWWDQSRNARHATQATAAYQPQIVDSGVLVTEGGKAAVRFDGGDDRLQTAAFSSAIAQPVTAFVTLAFSSSVDATQLAFDGRATANRFFFGADNSLLYSMQSESAHRVDGGTLATGLAIHSLLFNTTASESYKIGALIASGDCGVGTLDGVTIGNIRGVPSVAAPGYGFTGTISELIIYPTDQTALRTRIEGNINRHFGVF